MTLLASFTNNAQAQELDVIENLKATQIPILPVPDKPTPKPEPVKYKIIKSDTLTKIGKQFNVSVERLWQKNTQLTNPDLLKINDELTIPDKDEVIPQRAVAIAPKNASQPTGNGSVLDNSYTPGQCTWYVKNKKPSLPNNLGNASEWLYNAQAQGMATGLVPRAGAVGWTSGHVVYIESVNPDGTVNYTDMNGRWVAYEIGGGVRPANYYTYIY